MLSKFWFTNYHSMDQAFFPSHIIKILAHNIKNNWTVTTLHIRLGKPTVWFRLKFDFFGDRTQSYEITKQGLLFKNHWCLYSVVTQLCRVSPM